MDGPIEGMGGADIDPDLRRFMAINAAAYADHPPTATLPLAEARKVFETVRAQWRAGGPVMAATSETTVASRHGEVRVRIYDPTPEPGKPVLVYLHGGGWTIFSLDTHDRLMREYAARAGTVVIGVDYALSPEVRFPVALEQVIDVVSWLADGATVGGGDPRRLAIGGDSAGGNLALATYLSLRDQGCADRIAALLLNYAVLDIESSPEARARYGGPDYMLTGEEMAEFWANYLAQPSDAHNPLANPALAELSGLPPVFLAVAECDLLAEQSHAAAARMHAAGVEVTKVVYPGACHSFLEAVAIAPLADRALAEASDWLRAQLRR